MHRYWSEFPHLKGSVFIVTYGRSGSTLIQSVLQSIDGAHISGENNLALWPLFNTVRRARWTKSNWGDETEAPNHPWHGASAVEPRALGRKMVAAFTRHVIHPPHSARWIGFKEIRYDLAGDTFADFLDFMADSFPNAKFVFNSRNLKDVSQSRWWAERDFDEVAEQVRTMDDRFQGYAVAHPERCLHLAYEEYAGKPDGFRPLFDFLDEPFNRAAVARISAVKLTH